MPSKEWEGLEGGVREVLLAHQRAIPVRLGALAKELGVSILASTLAPGVSGEIRPEGASYCIRVNRHDSERRQRFTVAHEISHFLLHRGLIGSGIRDDVLYRSSLSDWVEAQANRLAADILMPRDSVLEERKKLEALGEEEQISELARKFMVSDVAMKIRLGSI